MSLFDLQDVCIAIGSLATLDLPMVVDLIVIYGLKGPYCTLTTTDWFLPALSVIPRGSWGDVARRFTMIRWAGLLVQPDEGVSDLVVDRIGDNLPQSTEKSRIIVITVGARHKCQRVLVFSACFYHIPDLSPVLCFNVQEPEGAVTRNYDVSNISRQLSGISNDDVSNDVITISRWIRRSAKEKLLTDEKNKGEVELLSAVSYSIFSRKLQYNQSRATVVCTSRRELQWIV
ncbi:Sel1-repeat containing protein [Dorcoceras hygrometricum]|uniref:Sel1-repeat containing protein n=1 Tax=Dorcoceras hygrometricum TaxID=472368 RepID=A0A2Z7CC85_9LAMI|nr:Sel1-repeat containing protein [Dorcoceras hygrometricum]